MTAQRYPTNIASLSCDLDNKWSYMKTHGDAGWDRFPSYLGLVVPRILRTLKERNLRITMFVVGQDAAMPEETPLLRQIADAGHEIGNHSFRHEPWLHLHSEESIRDDILQAEACIEQATGRRPVGFRGPGYSLSRDTLSILATRGYVYDASSFPTFVTPLVRLYYFATANLTAEEKALRRTLGGSFRDGFRPIQPYRWQVDGRHLLEIPVTTLPLLKLPMHMSYLFGLSRLSRRLALTYFDVALRLCRLFGVEPSIVLHPTDFLGREDGQGLSFIPGMDRPTGEKLDLVCAVLDRLMETHSVVTLREHAEQADQRSDLSEFCPTV